MKNNATNSRRLNDVEINSPTSFDVLIAGAGPAGCASAIRLTQLGLSVGLSDSVDDAKLKIGESIPGAILRMLNTLGINELSELLESSEFGPCHANCAAWGSEDWLFNDGIQNPEGGGWHVLRNRFDAGLRQKAHEMGVSYFNGLIDTISTSQDGFEVDFKRKEPYLPPNLTARFLVDASGRACAVLRQLKVERLFFEDQMAAFCWVNDDSEDTLTRVKTVKDGWWYSSVLPNKQRVIAFHGMSTVVADFVRDPALFLHEFAKSGTIETEFSVEAIFEGVQARDASVSRASEIFGQNWIAIGDTACAMDPITSQGIFHAMYTGIRGAEAIAQSLNGEKSALSNFSNAVARVFDTNQSLRMHHYTQELRFTENPYWKQYFK